MANLCPTSIHICRARFTRLNADGSLAPAPNNHIVSANTMKLTISPDIKAGESKEVVSGCDCIAVSYRGKDKLMRFNLELDQTAWEPALIELLLGASLLTNASAEAIGDSWPQQNNCAQTGQPPVAVEVWSDLWLNDSQNANPRYIRWIFPMTFWQISDFSLENDFSLPVFKGFTRSNTWANPYIDFPTGVTSIGTQGAFFWDNVIPAAYCGYSTTST